MCHHKKAWLPKFCQKKILGKHSFEADFIPKITYFYQAFFSVIFCQKYLRNMLTTQSLTMRLVAGSFKYSDF